MIKNIAEDVFEVDTFEAYNKDIFYKDDFVIMPYVNIQIFEDKSDDFRKGDKLNYSYLIFTEVSSISWNYSSKGEPKYGKKQFSILECSKNYFTEYVIGSNVFNDCAGAEYKIICKKMFLHFPSDVLIKNSALNPWTPIKTANFEMNLDIDKTKSFFELENIPNEILDSFELDSSSTLKKLDLFESISKEEEKIIAEKWIET